MNIALEEVVFAALLVVANEFLGSVSIFLASIVLVIFVSIGLLENVDFASLFLLNPNFDTLALIVVAVLPLPFNPRQLFVTNFELIVAGCFEQWLMG